MHIGNGGEMMVLRMLDAMAGLNVSVARLELSTEYFLIPSVPAIPVHRTPVPLQTGILRRDMWVAPLLVFSSLTMILIALFEVCYNICFYCTNIYFDISSLQMFEGKSIIFVIMQLTARLVRKYNKC